jgi:hypothetical protein
MLYAHRGRSVGRSRGGEQRRVEVREPGRVPRERRRRRHRRYRRRRRGHHRALPGWGDRAAPWRQSPPDRRGAQRAGPDLARRRGRARARLGRAPTSRALAWRYACSSTSAGGGPGAFLGFLTWDRRLLTRDRGDPGSGLSVLTGDWRRSTHPLRRSALARSVLTWRPSVATGAPGSLTGDLAAAIRVLEAHTVDLDLLTRFRRGLTGDRGAATGGSAHRGPFRDRPDPR